MAKGPKIEPPSLPKSDAPGKVPDRMSLDFSKLEVDIRKANADIDIHNRDAPSKGEPAIEGKFEIKDGKLEFMKNGSPVKFEVRTELPDGTVKVEEMSYGEARQKVEADLEFNTMGQKGVEKSAEGFGKQLAEKMGVKKMEGPIIEGLKPDFQFKAEENFRDMQKKGTLHVDSGKADAAAVEVNTKKPDQLSPETKQTLDTQTNKSLEQVQKDTGASEAEVGEAVKNLEKNPESLKETFEKLEKDSGSNGEKDFWEKTKEKLSDNNGALLKAALGALGAAGLMYLLIQSDMDEGTGCFVTVQNKVDSTKTFTCKEDRFICKPDNKSSSGVQYEACSGGNLEYELNENKTDVAGDGFNIAGLVKGTHYSIVNGKLQMNVDPCKPSDPNMIDEGNEACSKLCKNQFMLKDDGNNKYEYKCGKRTAADSFKRAGQLVTKLVNTAVKAGMGAGDILSGLLGTIKKYAIYFVIGIVILVVASKGLPWFLEKFGKLGGSSSSYDGGGSSSLSSYDTSSYSSYEPPPSYDQPSMYQPQADSYSSNQYNPYSYGLKSLRGKKRK